MQALEVRHAQVQTCSTSCSCSGNLHGNLKVRVKFARNLPDTDGWLNRPDPYVTVTGVKNVLSDLQSTILHTSQKKGCDPSWHQDLNFGCGDWKFIQIGVQDADHGRDDIMMPAKLYPLSHSGVCSSVYRFGSNAQLHFEIHFTIPVSGCSSHPCANGGTCTNTVCGRYYCTCRTGYSGNRCQHYYDDTTDPDRPSGPKPHCDRCDIP